MERKIRQKFEGKMNKIRAKKVRKVLVKNEKNLSEKRKKNRVKK